MNLKVIFTLLLLAIAFQGAFASFPVERQVLPPHSTTLANATTLNPDEEVVYVPHMAKEHSQGVALILALVLGLLAAHRWYLGTPWMYNIFFIFTLGGVGIWLFIDIVRIAVGDLTPAKGRYKKTFF